MKQKQILKAEHMSKHFGSTVALHDVSIEAYSGEVLGLIGENGSGKSTITSIVAGLQKADEGSMTFMGNPWNPSSMIDALEKGVGMIVQEAGTVQGISVAENIFLGNICDYTSHHLVNRKDLMKQAQTILDEIGADHISASDLTSALDMQDRKLVEIAKVMRQSPALLIVDETTTALSQTGREILYGIMNKMKEQGKTVIFISHDLDEIMNRCDRLTVLRDGNIITTFSKEQFDEDAIKTSMIGREVTGSYYREDWDGSYDDEIVMKAENINVPGSLKDVSVSLHRGEILGIGGLSDCGMHVLGKVLFGAASSEGGKVTMNGSIIKNEEDAMFHGVGYTSKDRDYESLVLQASVMDNIASGGLDKIARHGLIFSKDEKNYVDRQIRDLEIKCVDRNQYVSALSGGNKQKVVFGKWIGRDANVLILDCPTRGIDIGVKQMMYQLIAQMKKSGKSIVIISEEMAELIGMSDEILVMKDGEIQTVIHRSDHPQEADLIRYMI